MSRKNRNNNSKKLILVIIILSSIFLLAYFNGYFNTILQLGGQWSFVNVTLSQEEIKVGEGADLILKFNPTNSMIKECPGWGGKAFAVVSLYIDDNFYKIINMNDIKCSENTTLKINLPHNLSAGEHTIKAKIGVMRFLETKKSTTYRITINNSQMSGSIDVNREKYFFERQLTNQVELYSILVNNLNIKKQCYDVRDRLKSCHCGGKIGPLNEEGCESYACYARKPNSGPCTKTLRDWSWGYTTLDFSPIKNYLLNSEHTDFDYFKYIKMDNMVETTEKLKVIPETPVEPIVEIIPCEKIYFECWDKSKILQYDCIDNTNVKTSNVCPTSPEADLYIEDDENLQDSEGIEPTEKQGNSIYYIAGGIIILLIGGILYAKFKK